MCVVKRVNSKTILARIHIRSMSTIMKRFHNISRVFSVTLLLPALLFLVQTSAAQEVARTYDASPGGLLRLDIETGGSITIRGWERNEVEVNIFVSGQDGGDVIVDLNEIRNGIGVSTEYEGRHGRADVDIEIRVPGVFDINLETTGGDVRIEGVEGTIEGQTMGGDLEFDNLKGDIEFNTMGGSITLENSEVDGSVHTMGGEVRLEDVLGNVKGSTMGGEVTYRNVRANPNSSDQGEVEISTMGGEINVDEAVNGATVHTMGGSIRVRSASHHVKATTMGGEIIIDEIDGWVEANTMGGDVEVRMVGDPNKGDRHVVISSMGGDITLTVPDGLDMELDLEIKLDDRRDYDDYEIVSDFDLSYERSESGDRRKNIYASGTVGSGKHRIEIKTVSGNIYLKRGR